MKYLLSTLTAILILVGGCAKQSSQNNDSSQTDAPETSYTKAIATVHGSGDSDIFGTVTFEKVEDGVRVTAKVEGLSEGRHGFHIHQYGDCSAADLTSAGGHYNPTGNDHGSPTQDNRHMGDMGNIVANADGTAELNYVDPMIKLNGSNSVIGRSIMLHAGEDDLESQPSGAAGSRIACGVIGIDG